MFNVLTSFFILLFLSVARRSKPTLNSFSASSMTGATTIIEFLRPVLPIITLYPLSSRAPKNIKSYPG